MASPLQIICAYEFSRKHPNESHMICLVHSSISTLTDIQIKNTLNLFNFDEIIYLTRNKFNFWNSFLLILKILLIRLTTNERDYRVIIGDFFNSILHFPRIIFNPSEVILIDDGFSSYSAWNNYFKNSLYFYTRNKTIKKLLIIFRIYKSLESKRIKLFTVFNSYIVNNYGVFNDFSSTKNLLGLRNQEINENLVFFIGSKLSERGAVSIEDELSYLKNIFNYWKAHNKDVVYVAKRTSSKEKLNLINDLGYEILEIKYPIEIYLLRTECLPKNICLFGHTSVLFTLSVSMPELSLFSINLPPNFFNYIEDVEAYKQFQELSLKINHHKWINIG